jgi:hypothetical protein
VLVNGGKNSVGGYVNYKKKVIWKKSTLEEKEENLKT